MYVLGELSPEEKSSVEKIAQDEVLVKQEIYAIQEALSLYATQFKLMPPPKEDIYAAILAAEKEDNSAAMFAIEKEGKAQNSPNSTQNTPITAVVLPASPVIAPVWSNYRYLAAAAIFLLIGSGIANIYLYNKWNEAKIEVAELSSNKESLTQQVNTKTEAYQKAKARLAAITNVETSSISLAGTSGYSAIVYWNEKTGDVYMNPTELKTPPKGRQYQLWAIVNGAPVSMGMLSDIEDKAEAIQKMNSVMKPQAFAVTLEPTGGSPAPTSDILVSKAI